MSEETPQTNNESSESNSESREGSKVEVNTDAVNHAPKEFEEAPTKYFEEKGVNIKKGEIKYDDEGKVREDPTAVKDLPDWTDKDGKPVKVVGKRVNSEKAEIGKTGNAFHEYQMMEMVSAAGLPAPRPLAKVEGVDANLIIMEKAMGMRWNERREVLSAAGMSTQDIAEWDEVAKSKMEALAEVFEEHGINRGWKLQDMVFDLDQGTKSIRSIIPTDWERTAIDLEVYEKKKQESLVEPLSFEEMVMSTEERIAHLEDQSTHIDKNIQNHIKAKEDLLTQIESTQRELGMEVLDEVPLSVRIFTQKTEELEDKKKEIQKKIDKIKEKALEKEKVEAEVGIILMKKVKEFFFLISVLKDSDFEKVLKTGLMPDSKPVVLEGGVTVPSDLASELALAYKNGVTDMPSLLREIPGLVKVKASLKRHIKRG